MLDFSAKLILCDIEGTTTSISFVKDELFPYAERNCKSFLQKTWSTAATQGIVDNLIKLEQYKEFAESNVAEINADQITNFVINLIKKDLKLGPLKQLQGLIWEEGYKTGELKGHIYDDVPEAFKRWQEAGLQIAIYSSGSVRAQQLLFGSSQFGNLLPYLSAHFDTAIGYKQEKQSYLNIATAVKRPPVEILFLTDIPKEAAAARAAGFQVLILNRPGNAPLNDADKAEYEVVNNFNEFCVKLSS